MLENSPSKTTLKQDAEHELSEVEHLHQHSMNMARLTFYLFFLLLSGLCFATWLGVLKLPSGYFLGLCLIIFSFNLLVQILFMKNALFWQDKTHSLKRYIKDLPLTSDEKLTHFGLRELEHEPLVASSVISRSFKNLGFLISNGALLLLILYTRYQAW